jgi:type I restriction enzyme M protein
MQQKVDRITDILRRDDGISGAMHYTEQISWILFLKFLNDYENEKSAEALLDGKDYAYVLDEEHRWSNWACPKNADGSRNMKAPTGDDLNDYVKGTLFPYLKDFKNSLSDFKSLKYKIGEIFGFIDNRIASGHTLREILDILDELDFQNEKELFELSNIYEKLLKGMGSDGGNSGEFYTPRAVVSSMVEALNPSVGEKVYDGAAGTCGFLIEAYEFIKNKTGELTTEDWVTLHKDTLYGNEKTPLAYIMGMMNMILHGIESPNLFKQNTLTTNIRDIQEKDRYHIILANPPFGGKEKSQIQQNFPVQANATELLFLQHFMKTLRQGGKAAIVVPEGVLFQTGSAFSQVKQALLEDFNLHTIVSLPAGVFLPYSGVKTNIIFFERTGSTSDIWYYEVDPGYKLTKNKPINQKHMEEFLELYPKRSDNERSWTVKVDDIKDFDISAKNPNNQEDIEHLAPTELLEKIKDNDKSITSLMDEVAEIIGGGYE